MIDLRPGSSFKDPSGHVFEREGTLYRQINDSYQEEYDLLMSSGLYKRLVKNGKLIPHEEVNLPGTEPSAYKIIKPEKIEFISYPYEWSFSQLKDAARLTLQIALDALDHGMILKDASAYNVQFHKGKPVFIDTLSFDRYVEGKPWDGYRQFCQHFLAPLALAAHVDIRLLQLLKTHIDGIPLDLASKLLPFKTKLDLFGLAITVHQHARMQQKYSQAADQDEKRINVSIPKYRQQNLVKALLNSIDALQWKPQNAEWGDYYDFTNYSKEAQGEKADIVGQFIEQARPQTVWDLGANIGKYSRLVAARGIFTVAFDIDPDAVEANYLAVKKEKETSLLPLVMDFSNPSPDLGWSGTERDSFIRRGPADMILALALIHHLAISNNVPLEKIARFFGLIGKWAVVEFVPKEDSQVQKLLRSRKDIFSGYTIDCFEEEFRKYYEIVDRKPVKDSKRTLYLLKAKTN